MGAPTRRKVYLSPWGGCKPTIIKGHPYVPVNSDPHLGLEMTGAHGRPLYRSRLRMTNSLQADRPYNTRLSRTKLRPWHGCCMVAQSTGRVSA